MHDPVTDRILGAAIEVHQNLGPGLLESTYERCLLWEFLRAGIQFENQAALPIMYKGHHLDAGYRIDFVVECRVILEIEAVANLDRIHMAQVLTYLKLTRLRTWLLINFNVRLLKDGVKRLSL